MAKEIQTINIPVELPDSKQYDASYLRYLTRKMLVHVEGAISLSNSSKTYKFQQMEQRHNLLFGKASVVNSLATLADLLIRLNQLPESDEMKVAGDDTASSLSEYDITLIKNFVKKHNNNPTLNLLGHTEPDKKL